ncbi:MAG: DUF1109 domain-containing protein [Alteraurantiacibacter sp.]
MNETDHLIDRLAANTDTPRHGVLTRFMAPMAGAAAICALGAVLVLDAAFVAVTTHGYAPLLVKWSFSIALVILSGIALWFIGRPGRPTGAAMAALGVPFVVVGALLALDLAMGRQSFPGETLDRCLTAMAVMSPIAFAGAILAARWLAPVHLRRAGLAAGLFGGAVAMTAYSPFCPERGMVNMAIFYCLPILAMSALGYLLGPRLLRW